MNSDDKKTEYYNDDRLVNNDNKHNYLKLKIGVCGATEAGTCGVNAYDIAKELGRQIVIQNGVLVTGATTGFSLWSAMGAKEEKGFSIGISPAANEKEHIDVYRLPLEYMDLIIYTGFGFPGRDLLFTRNCDAIIIGCGRIGVIHEFTIAFEEGKPVGVLEGDWATDKTIKTIIEKSNSSNNIIFGKDIRTLVKKIIEMVEKNKKSL